MNNHKSSKAKSGKALGGLILIVIGTALLLRRMDFYFPGWVFSWPMILIIIGLFVGIRHRFRHPAALILLLIGGVFLANRIMDGVNYSMFLWPTLIIGIGLWLIFGRSKSYRHSSHHWNKRVGQDMQDEPSAENMSQTPFTENVSDEDYLDSVSIFGGVKKVIVSKNFQGGEIVNFFGGAELNLMQADISGKITLDVTQVFGGTRIIVPADWVIHSEMAAIFGGIEDKRFSHATANTNKVIVIKGTSIFGGIDIRSF